MNQRRSHFPLLELSVGLGGVSFGDSRSLSASANAFCSRQRMDVSQAFPSRSADRLSKVWKLSASAARQPFGGAARAPSSNAAFHSGPFVLPTPTPNHALQRTPGFGVQLPSAAVVRPAQSRAVRPAMKPGTARAFALRWAAPMRVPGPESLSLGSLGVARQCYE